MSKHPATWKISGENVWGYVTATLRHEDNKKMPFFTHQNLHARTSRRFQKSETILLENSSKAPYDRQFDIFLSHSYLDADEILALKDLIDAMGFSVYVDWVIDKEWERNKVTAKTADRLRQRMTQCQSLLYATSGNSTGSKWMPWELGYFDGRKGRVAVLPVLEEDRVGRDYLGQEYLGLYPYVIYGTSAGGDKETLWVFDNADKYVTFSKWLTGTNPHFHT